MTLPPSNLDPKYSYMDDLTQKRLPKIEAACATLLGAELAQLKRRLRAVGAATLKP